MEIMEIKVEQKLDWIICPVCGNKTRLKMRNDTIMKNFPLYCPKCKKESLIEVKDFEVINVNEKPHS